MPGRSGLKNHCSRCRIYRPLCLCRVIAPIELETRLVVLMHWRETKLTTNTAALACLALPHSEIRIRGLPDEPLSTDGVIPAVGSAILLYPSLDSQVLTADALQGLARPLTLIVPDGSWRQASKVALRERTLDGVPRFRLPPGPPSEYRLRHSPHPQNLSTFEAIARALGILEGEKGPGIQVSLELLFRTMVERRLWARGKLKPAECPTGIPEEALQAALLSGYPH